MRSFVADVLESFLTLADWLQCSHELLPRQKLMTNTWSVKITLWGAFTALIFFNVVQKSEPVFSCQCAILDTHTCMHTHTNTSVRLDKLVVSGILNMAFVTKTYSGFCNNLRITIQECKMWPKNEQARWSLYGAAVRPLVNQKLT